MKVSYKLDYALKTLLDLALYHQKELASIADLSKKLCIPKKFLEQILLELKRGAFVESKRGKIGGYLLAKKPSEITIGEVARLIDGPTEPIECLDSAYRGCEDLNTCMFRKIWFKVNEATSAIIDNITLADVINDYKLAKNIMDYSI